MQAPSTKGNTAGPLRGRVIVLTALGSFAVLFLAYPSSGGQPDGETIRAKVVIAEGLWLDSLEASIVVYPTAQQAENAQIGFSNKRKSSELKLGSYTGGAVLLLTREIGQAKTQMIAFVAPDGEPLLSLESSAGKNALAMTVGTDDIPSLSVRSANRPSIFFQGVGRTKQTASIGLFGLGAGPAMMLSTGGPFSSLTLGDGEGHVVSSLNFSPQLDEAGAVWYDRKREHLLELVVSGDGEPNAGLRDPLSRVTKPLR